MTWTVASFSDRNPSSFCFLVHNKAKVFYLNLTGITKLEYARKIEMNSGLSSKKTSSCKWGYHRSTILLLFQRYNPGQNLLRQIAKMPIFSYHPGKN